MSDTPHPTPPADFAPLADATRSDVQKSLHRAGLPEIGPTSATMATYLQTLANANTRLSLTAIQDPETLLERFVTEPLIGWHHILALLGNAPGPTKSLIDVGSGGGAPGLPIAIAEPTWNVTLVESRRRKAEFLSTTARQLDLDHVTVAQTRIETLAHGPNREQFDVAVARALAPLPITLELLLPLVTVGGLVAVWSGPSAHRQRDITTQFAQAAGGAVPDTTTLTWPESDRTLVLVTTRKHTPSPTPFPRSLQRIRNAVARAAQSSPH